MKGGREGSRGGGRERERGAEKEGSRGGGEINRYVMRWYTLCVLSASRGWPMTLVVMSSLESSNVSNWKHCLGV